MNITFNFALHFVEMYWIQSKDLNFMVGGVGGWRGKKGKVFEEKYGNKLEFLDEWGGGEEYWKLS